MTQRKIWLVWTRWTYPNGNPCVSLRAVDESGAIATRHKKMLEMENPEQDVWIERSLSNHCYGARDVVMAGMFTKKNRRLSTGEVTDG